MYGRLKLKKRIFPLGYVYLLLQIIILTMVAFSLYAFCYCIESIVGGVVNALIILGIIASIWATAYCMSYFILLLFRNIIELQENQIFVQKGVGRKGENLIQHEKHIVYSEITDISFAYTLADSEGMSIRRLFRPVFYILFFDKSECVKAVSMMYFTKKQIQIFIDNVLERCKEIGNTLAVASGKEFLLNAMKEIKSSEKRKK